MLTLILLTVGQCSQGLCQQQVYGVQSFVQPGYRQSFAQFVEVPQVNYVQQFVQPSYGVQAIVGHHAQAIVVPRQRFVLQQNVHHGRQAIVVQQNVVRRRPGISLRLGF